MADNPTLERVLIFQDKDKGYIEERWQKPNETNPKVFASRNLNWFLACEDYIKDGSTLTLRTEAVFPWLSEPRLAIGIVIDPRWKINEKLVERIVIEHDEMLFDTITNGLKKRIWGLWSEKFQDYPESYHDRIEAAKMFISKIWEPAEKLRKELKRNGDVAELLLGTKGLEYWDNQIDSFIYNAYMIYENTKVTDSNIDLCGYLGVRVMRGTELAYQDIEVANYINSLYIRRSGGEWL